MKEWLRHFFGIVDPQLGEVWKGSGNPFRAHVVRILAVSKGYVQYQSTQGWISDCSIGTFKSLYAKREVNDDRQPQ